MPTKNLSARRGVAAAVPPGTPSPPHRPPPALLDAEAVARRLGLSLRSVRRLIARGELPVHRLGRAVRISEDDLVRFLATHRHV